ncbi:olfactory receptor 52D1-like [Pelodytes ibericus]
MEYGSNTSTSLVLLGIAEMEGFGYLFIVLSLVIYLFIMLLSAMIVLVVLAEDSLHEPMYILIGNLAVNGIFGSSSLFPKLIFDLLTSSKTISHVGCLLQLLCVTVFIVFEVALFTVMAYDRYLAVCHPLHYVTMMTNKKTLELILGSLVFSVTSVSIAVLLTSRLPLCGTQIKSIYCDNMSIIILSYLDSTINKLYGGIITIGFLCVTIIIIAYSYFRIFTICFNVSKDLHSKAIHTLVTHLLGFSLLLVGFFFIFIRYRLGSINLPVLLHVFLSVTYILFPPLLNHIIYGLRTKALKLKMVSYIQKIIFWCDVSNPLKH